jgi:predicted GIY-YIG superfamily endonuclease
MYCYLLYTDDGRRTYIGATVDPDRRLRQHNREIQGGAKSTHGKAWTRACMITGFPDWRATLQFEWAWKYHGRKLRGLGGKLEALLNLLQSPQSTSSATPFRLWSKPPALCVAEDMERDVLAARFPATWNALKAAAPAPTPAPEPAITTTTTTTLEMALVRLAELCETQRQLNAAIMKKIEGLEVANSK